MAIVTAVRVNSFFFYFGTEALGKLSATWTHTHTPSLSQKTGSPVLLLEYLSARRLH